MVSKLLQILTGFSIIATTTLIPKTAEAPQYSNQDEAMQAPKGIVVLDPGHDYINFGYHYKGVKEEDLTLDIAKNLQQKLWDEGYYVLLTRTDSSGVNKDSIDYDHDGKVNVRDELIARTEFAKEHHPDYFISLHFNAYPRSWRVNGTEIYFYGVRGKRDLNDRRKNFYHPQSVRVADDSSKVFALHLEDFLKEESYKTTALGTDMRVLVEGPAVKNIMLEFGYLTNPTDFKLATTKEGHEKYTESILDYFRTKTHP